MTEEIVQSCFALSIDLSVGGDPVIVLQTGRYDLYTDQNVLERPPLRSV